MHGKQEDFYIYPSSKMSYFLRHHLNDTDRSGDISNVLITLEENVVKQVRQNIDSNILEKQEAEATITADHDSHSDDGGGKEDMSVDEKPKPATKKSKLKKEKDKNEPKRAPSAYILFCNDKRAGIVEENPDVDQVEIMKKMGELWREAGDDVKAKYAEKSKKLSAVANEKIQAYRKEKQEAEATITADHDSHSDDEKIHSKQKRKSSASDGVHVDKKKAKKAKSKNRHISI